MVEVKPMLIYDKHYIRVKRHRLIPLNQLKGAKKENIKNLSDKSRQKMIEYLDGIENFRPRYMLTLTYEGVNNADNFPTDGRQIKQDLYSLFNRATGRAGFSSFMDRSSRWFWKLEFQPDRGAPHFHILIDTVNDDWDYLKDKIQSVWEDIEGSHRHHAQTKLERIRDEDGIALYISLHTSKDLQNNLPDGFHNVGRWWGFKGGKATYLDRFESEIENSEAEFLFARIMSKKEKIAEKYSKKPLDLWTKDSCGVMFIDKDRSVIERLKT